MSFGIEPAGGTEAAFIIIQRVRTDRAPLHDRDEGFTAVRAEMAVTGQNGNPA